MSEKIAFVFPGQGSQSIGMLEEFYSDYPIVAKTYEEASEALGYDIWDKIKNGPEEELNRTDITQPAILATGVATWRVICEQSELKPSLMAGHSLGEYTALVCGESIAFADALKLVEKRGKLMQEAVPQGEGLMAAVLGLDDDKVISVCKDAEEGQVVSAVNFNAPGQVVIAGSKDAVERACVLLKENGARRAQPLAVSVPSHCQLMKPAADQLAEELKSIEIRVPTIPVIHNYNVGIAKDSAEIIDNLTKQLYCPVRWVESVLKISESGIENIIECGPGKVLAGLNKRIAKQVPTLPIFDKKSFDAAVEKTA